MNPLALHHLVHQQEPLVLPPDHPVEVELGSGDGQFLFERARAAPEGFYIGVEIRQDLVQTIRRRALANVTAVCANLLVSAELFAPARVTRFFVNFPDPCFKRRHKVRRWFTRDVAVRLTEALCPAGEIFVQSDVFEVALDALSILETVPTLTNAAGAWRFTRANLFGARSRREQGCEAHGLAIWRLLFVKSKRSDLEPRDPVARAA